MAPRRLRSLVLLTTASSAAAAAAAAAASISAVSSSASSSSSPSDHPRVDPLQSLLVASKGVFRSSRAVYTFAVNSFDYKYSLRQYDHKSEEYYKTQSLVHSRAANRLLKLCEANKGFYIKGGQFIGSLRNIPKEYVTALSTLQDKAFPYPFEDVQRVLEEELGQNFLDIYQEFDKKPIAAASIAQVHRASLKNGQEVAVKVQYPLLSQNFRIDIATMDILSRTVAWLFPEYQLQWIVPEFEKTSLKELDFEQEAHNAERTAKMFQGNANVKIPRILWNMTSRRVLTMEFMHGFKIDDMESLRGSGIDPRKVAQVLVEIFANMIFLHGHVHGDPHPGNILISPTNDQGKGQFQLVLLDHGLYRELNEGFRSDFCHLWKALVLADPAEIQRVGERLGAGKYFKYLPVIFTGRTLNSTSILGERMSLEERKKLRDDLRMLTIGDISQFMEGLPRDVLIILRTDGLVKSITSKLGAEPRMRLITNARYAISGLSLETHGNGLVDSFLMQLEYINLHIRLEFLAMYFRLRDLYTSLGQKIRSFFDWTGASSLLTNLGGPFPWVNYKI